MNLNWTEERVEYLKQRTADGLTCSQIGREMGLSRNAVIGKQHRLKIRSTHSQGAVPGSKQNRPKRTQVTKLRKTAGGHSYRFVETTTSDPWELPMEIFPNPKPLLDLERDQCRWPDNGDGLAMLFCGAPAFEGHSYCFHHCCIAYQKPKPPTDRGEIEQHLRKLAKDYKAAA